MSESRSFYLDPQNLEAVRLFNKLSFKVGPHHTASKNENKLFSKNKMLPRFLVTVDFT